MRAIAVVVGAVGVIALLASPADAAAKKRHPLVMRSAAGTVIQPTRTIIHHPNGTTTVIVVPRRSYLDIGTEVSRGDSKSMDYMLPVGGDPGRPDWFYGPDLNGMGGSLPIPRAFDIPGYNPNTPF